MLIWFASGGYLIQTLGVEGIVFGKPKKSGYVKVHMAPGKPFGVRLSISKDSFGYSRTLKGSQKSF
ncbi:hypothetical protein BSG1_04055 [Bacillus sp. SG-1]|nr:hypothetical protein BSG1_04055 [Bacillus sp. SG-1]